MYNKKFSNKIYLLILILVLFLPMTTSFSQIETKPIPAISFLGINLGMAREQVIDSATLDFISDSAKLLEMDEYSSFGSIGSIDETIIKARAIPFIKQIYFQFLKDPRNDELRLYEILIHFDKLYVGYFELLDILNKGLEIENPDFDPSSPESDTNFRLIRYKAYGTPAIVESERAIWGIDEESKVKIILTRSNKINQFGNVVRFIHKDGFKLVKAINNPRSGIDISSIEFSELSESLSPDPLYTPDIIGRRLFFISALFPQELQEQQNGNN